MLMRDIRMADTVGGRLVVKAKHQNDTFSRIMLRNRRSWRGIDYE